MFLTSSYVFRTAADAAARFAGEVPGNVYSRYTNPTVRAFEERIAALEGAEQAVATASGMSAILSIVMSQCSAGDHVLVSRSVFGSTISLFEKYLKRFGVEVDYPPLADLAGWEAAFKPNTRLLFVESPSNPWPNWWTSPPWPRSPTPVAPCWRWTIASAPRAAAAAEARRRHRHAFGHQYIDGQGRSMGGVVAGRKAQMEGVVGFLRTAGPTLSPFNAWIFLKGLETLRVRMQAHCASALELARWLEQQPGIERVYYAGLESHPQHELAKRQQSAFGAVVSFEVAGGSDAAWRFIDATRVISITTNLGDTKTTIAHPATTSHGRLSPQERANAGIGDNLIRVAVGLEDIADLKADLARGLAAL